MTEPMTEPTLEFIGQRLRAVQDEQHAMRGDIRLLSDRLDRIIDRLDRMTDRMDALIQSLEKPR